MNVFRELVFSGEFDSVPSMLIEKVLEEIGVGIMYGKMQGLEYGDQHWELVYDNHKCEFHANRFDPETFLPLIEWVGGL